MMKLKPITVTVQLAVAGPTEVQAWQVNQWFAVNQEVVARRHWRVTHIPTGLCAAQASSRDAAARVARRLAAVRGVDWASADPEFIHVAPREIRERVRAISGVRGPNLRTHERTRP